MQVSKSRGFTLVELLVVIGIIALLIGILLPALAKARDSAYAVKCGANLHSVGQGMAIYLAENHQTFPAAYIYNGMQLVGQSPNGMQSPPTAQDGYINWSSFIFGQKGGLDKVAQNTANNSAYLSQLYNDATSWQMFQCPTIEKGGLPPTNPSASNLDVGQSNDDGANVVDFQAPRMAYTVNEAICPRNKFEVGFQNAVRTYYYVRAGSIALSAQTILATEWNQNWKIVSEQARAGGGLACKSHRPVHAFAAITGASEDGTDGNNGLNMDQIPTSFRGNQNEIGRVTASQLSNNPDDAIANAPATGFKTRLDWVGRNHGIQKLDSRGRNIRRSNFLYVDGHVELKSIYDTFAPWQWGMQFYSLNPSSDVLNQ